MKSSWSNYLSMGLTSPTEDSTAAPQPTQLNITTTRKKRRMSMATVTVNSTSERQISTNSSIYPHSLPNLEDSSPRRQSHTGVPPPLKRSRLSSVDELLPSLPSTTSRTRPNLSIFVPPNYSYADGPPSPLNNMMPYLQHSSSQMRNNISNTPSLEEVNYGFIGQDVSNLGMMDFESCMKPDIIYPHSAPAWRTNFDTPYFHQQIPTAYPTPNYPDHQFDSTPYYNYMNESIIPVIPLESFDQLSFLPPISPPNRPRTAPSNDRVVGSPPGVGDSILTISHRRHVSNPSTPIEYSTPVINSTPKSPTTPSRTMNRPKKEIPQSPITPIRVPMSKSGHKALTFINYSGKDAVLLCEAVAPSGSRKRVKKVVK